MRTALICIFLLVCGFITALLLEGNPLAKAKPEDRSLEQLFADLKIENLPAGSRRVEVQLQDLKGADVDISDFRGKIVFLNFWATWCATCVVEMPAMEKLHRTLKDQDFALVTVSIQDSAAAVRHFFNERKLTFTALLDSSGKTVPGFAIRAIPTTLILDKAGRIIGRAVGPREWASRESIAMFRRLAGRQAGT